MPRLTFECYFVACRQPGLFWIGDVNGPDVSTSHPVFYACADHVEMLRRPHDIVIRLADRVRVG